MDRTDEDIHKIVAYLRAQRKNFRELENAKAAGTVSSHARKLPSTPKKAAADSKGLKLDDLEIKL